MSDRSTTWISRGFEALIAQQQALQRPLELGPNFDYDVIIIGSGYGGAIAASQLAGLTHNNKPLRICLLERGTEYLQGMFPSHMAELPKHVRFGGANPLKYQDQKDGLFDFRLNPDLNVLVANGLGGGSLINAGVMLEAKPRVFNHRWPTGLRASQPDNLFSGYYDAAKQLLEVKDSRGSNLIDRHQNLQHQALPKHQALKRLATGRSSSNDASKRANKQSTAFFSTPLTIAMENKTNGAGVQLSACNLCGDCATGCNHNAKNSLDTNLLVEASRLGVEIYTGASVLKLTSLAPVNSGWCLSVVHTKKHLREREGNPTTITASKVILAAGTLGSTEILKRSQSPDLTFSQQLGQRFSSNGDMLSAVFGQELPVNAVAREDLKPEDRQTGPTITSMIDLRESNASTPLLIEEMTVPSSLHRLFEEVTTTLNSASNLNTMDTTTHQTGHPSEDPHAINAEAIRNTATYVLMGDDGAKGSLQLVDSHLEPDSDGHIQVQWPDLSNHPLFEKQIATLRQLTHRAKIGGTLLTNPIWSKLAASDKNKHTKGPLLTVHPLGGCAMANDVEQGVVNDIGQVFVGKTSRTLPTQIHPGLVVLDGAIVPSALGANPALTIAALSLRAIQHLIKTWGFNNKRDKSKPVNSTPVKYPPPLTRPIYSDNSVPFTARKTRIEINERLTGQVTLTNQHQQAQNYTVDLTLGFHDFAIQDFTHNKLRCLTVRERPSTDETTSQLRIFEQHKWEELRRKGAKDREFDQHAILVSPVSGTLDIMSREASTPTSRIQRTLWPWLRNQGLRVLWQHLTNWLQKKPKNLSLDIKSYQRRFINRLNEIKALSSRGGEIRTFKYQLQLQRPINGWPSSLNGFDDNATHAIVNGFKRITYTKHPNPLRQLQDMYLEQFPGLQPSRHQHGKGRAFLRYDPRFLIRDKVPFINIIEQQNRPAALADSAAFLNYFLRALLNIHIRSFQRYDRPTDRASNRLPGPIAGIAAPQFKELPIKNGQHVVENGSHSNIRLTRYPGSSSSSSDVKKSPPIIMIHGHSGNGTTYTHPSLKPSLAQYFWNKGRDVWVLDLRTSSGMPSALHPWTFEDIALADIPVAIDHICKTTQQEKVDIIAHCMGSSILSMAILSSPKSGEYYYQERKQLHRRINKVVLSQVGPKVVFSTDNLFKAYLLSYLRHAVPSATFAFQRSDSPSTLEQLLDRVVSTIPYPDDEIRLENPARPWVNSHYANSRRRLDSLYGQTFKLSNLSTKTLNHLDDFFGPLNLKTLSGATQFAVHEHVTNKHGYNEFVSNENLKKFWHFPTLSIHGSDNSVADITTIHRMEQTMSAAGCDYHSEILPGFGHQDSLIGKDAILNFHKIAAFLDAEPCAKQSSEQSSKQCTDDSSSPTEHPHRFHCETPYSGPVIGSLKNTHNGITGREIAVSLGVNPQRIQPDFVLFVAVEYGKDNIRLAGDTNIDNRQQLQSNIRNNTVVQFADPIQQNWIKTVLALSPAFERADGILVLLLDDQHINTDELSCVPQCSSQLPNNLLDLLDYPEKTNVGSTLSRYLTENIISDSFVRSLENILQQPKQSLESAIIQWPKCHHKQTTQFALGACQYPSGILDRTLAYASYERLATRLDKGITSTPKNLSPEFILLMGDQVYTDATAGLFDPVDQHDRFTLPYHKWLSQRSVKSVFRRLPSFMMLDDHELRNNWDRADITFDELSCAESGKMSYFNFQRNAHQQPITGNDKQHDIPLWYSFNQNNFDFFMLDTRTERDGRCISKSNVRKHIQTFDRAKLISDQQYNALITWLETTDKNKPRFIVSASMLLPRRLHSTKSNATLGALHSDAWDGYPYTMHKLLTYIAEHDIQHLVFLSGDEHLSNIAKIKLKNPTKQTITPLHSIHSSALYAPYPFANSNKAMFAERETFELSLSNKRTEACTLCEVDTSFYPGDGFALVSAYQTKGRWQLECEFDRVDGETNPPRHRFHTNL